MSTSQTTPMDRHEHIPPENIDVPRASTRVNPGVRIALAIVAIAIGCAAISTSVLALIAGDVAPPPDPAGLRDAPDRGDQWLTLLSGICWFLAGVFTWRGSLWLTTIFFIIGLATGVLVTI